MWLLKSAIVAAVIVSGFHFAGDVLSEGVLNLYHTVPFDPLYLLYQVVRGLTGLHVLLGSNTVYPLIAFSILTSVIAVILLAVHKIRN